MKKETRLLEMTYQNPDADLSTETTKCQLIFPLLLGFKMYL